VRVAVERGANEVAGHDERGVQRRGDGIVGLPRGGRPMTWRTLTRPGQIRLVVFDCDSTLSAVEGIDELAAGRRAEVSALTDAAMRGDVPLESVYGTRLDLIRPDRTLLAALALQYVEALVPDAGAVVAALHAAGIRVRIMSGGLLPAVQAVARVLGVADEDTAAVAIRFDERGAYVGYDEASPLARSAGKRELLRQWRTELALAREAVMMVGDGATDLEAAQAAGIFVAYAGVVERPAVMAAADAVVRSASLSPILPLALGGAPPPPSANALYERGIALLNHNRE
jgi:phosphoserine phosphatase